MKKLHRDFGHPYPEALFKLLQKSKNTKSLDSSTLATLKDITKRCQPCQKWAPKPARFRVSFPTDQITFNHEIEVDIFWLDISPALHIIDRGTRYSVAKFMENESSEHVWDLIVEFWITVFTGYPQIISHDQGSQFKAAYFQVSCSQLGIISKETPTQSHNSLALCERYHYIIRRVYNKLKEDFPCQNKKQRLALSVHAVNNTAGPDGITPSILVYGSVPRLPLPDTRTMLATQIRRFEAMRAARREMETITAQRRISAALKHRHDLRPFPVYKFGDKVRIWREELNRFAGPYTVHGYDNEKTVYVMTDKIRPFSTSVVRLIPPDSPTDITPKELSSVPPAIYKELEKMQSEIGPSVPTDKRFYDSICNAFFQEPFSKSTLSAFASLGACKSYITVTVKDKNDSRFTQAKMDEVEQLVKMGTFKFVPESSISKNGTLLHSRFVLTIKNFEEPNQYFKARLVILGHVDPEKPRVVNEAPTVLKSSVRLVLTLIASHSFTVWSRDITLAFIQSKENLKRDVYVRPPKGENILSKIGAPPGSILKAIKPQYGLAESPGYWWQTFRDWHVTDLKMGVTALDPCFFFKHGPQGLEGIQITQVDDTCGGGNNDFSILESKQAQKFNSKPRTSEMPIKFNGSWIDKLDNNNFIIHQKDYGRSIFEMQISSPQTREQKFQNFRSLRGRIAYIASCTRPDLAYHAAHMSHITSDNITDTDINFLNSAVRKANEHRHIVLPKLDLKSLYVVGYADAGFANNRDLSSQLGFIVLLKDKADNAAIIHYGSWKCHRVTRSVLGAEIYAFSHCLDFVLALAQYLSTILKRKVKTVMFTDSKCLFDTITKLSSVSEKRLLIDIAAIRETYSNGDLSNVAHVASAHNLANVFTKFKADSTMLNGLMASGNLTHPISQWILPQ